MRRNPCELQIDLFCHGVRVDPSCFMAREGRRVARLRAGLGSGLEMILPGEAPIGRDIWVNAPTDEIPVSGSPYLLRCDDEEYRLVDLRTDEIYRVNLPDTPGWYDRHTSSGTLMRQVGVLQGTYLGIYVCEACGFWAGPEPMNCRFCTTGLNVEGGQRSIKEIDDVVETARAAKEESGVTFVHLNTGYQGGQALQRLAPYVDALKRRVGVLVGVQAVPEGPRSDLDRLIDLGCDHLSFCFEFHDPATFARICPGKAKVVGQQAFFDALAYCQGRMPRGSCSGEIIAGIEPVEETLAAICEVTELGAFPTVCIFRPLVGSDMADWPFPEYAEMRRVMRHMWESCRDRDIPIGLAPNINVSLVVQPGDAAYLCDLNWRDRWYLWKLGLRRRMAAPVFRRRMAAHAP